MNSYLDPSLLEQYRQQRLLSMQRHPQVPHLQIWNYTAECQYSKAWDAVTTQCRGLILDTQRERVVANPFPKFYNWGDPMVGEIPLEEPIITEKVDGSLGILYWIGDNPHIATRGSFTSEQALWATKWFRQHVAYQSLPRHVTYLVEIVYPENRIVVAYPYEGCVLLAARETATGTDYATIPYQHLFPLRAKQIPVTDLEALAAMDEPNSEGFVLHWPRHGQRVKIKFPTYCALHRVITGLSVRVIYEHLASGQPLSALLDVAPDEMYPWIQEKAETLQCEYDRIEAHARIVVKEAQRRDKYPTRKDQAALITSLAYPGVCFSLLDGKDPAPSIWKLLRPAGSETYRQEIEI